MAREVNPPTVRRLGEQVSYKSLISAHVIVNPAAGRGAGERALDPVARAFRQQGWAVEVTRTGGPGEGAALATAAVHSGAQRVVAVGGDGTVHEVANGLLRSGGAVPLGVVPLGTGNDFAKLVGVHGCAPATAVGRLVTADARVFDVGRVGDERFVNSLGVGFGPAVVRARNAMPGLRGFLSYFVPVLRAYGGFRPPLVEIRSAEFRERGYVMMVEVCNGTTAGGDYRFAPDADPADGRLDVCLVRRVALPRFLLAIPRVMRGTHGRMREVALFRTRRLTLRSPEEPLLLHLDGELREPGTNEVTVEVERRKLKVLVAQ